MKKDMIKKLIAISNALDEKGAVKEANYLDSIIKSAMWEGILPDAWEGSIDGKKYLEARRTLRELTYFVSRTERELRTLADRYVPTDEGGYKGRVQVKPSLGNQAYVTFNFPEAPSDRDAFINEMQSLGFSLQDSHGKNFFVFA